MYHYRIRSLSVERLIGPLRRELLDQIPFWGASDLEQKLLQFRDYHNDDRAHASLHGRPPICKTAAADRSVVDLNDYLWRSYCRGLYQLPLPLDWQFATDRGRPYHYYGLMAQPVLHTMAPQIPTDASRPRRPYRIESKANSRSRMYGLSARRIPRKIKYCPGRLPYWNTQQHFSGS